jgi:hypothetical protein
MTLIISYADEDGGIVVSDRFTSIGNKVINRNFNKLIHVIGEDCSLVISFTGHALIGSVPTDTKIAEWICGEKMNDRTITISKGRHASSFKTRSDIVGNIAKGLKKASRRSYELNLEIAISGQHIYRNHLLPFFCVMRKLPRNFLVSINGSKPLHYLVHPNSHTFISGGYGQAYKILGDKIFHQIRETRIKSCNRSDLTDVLVSGLRAFADKQPFAIGRSVQVIKSSFMDRKSIVSFYNAMDFGAVSYSATLLKVTNPCNSPWIITPVGTLAPLIVYGSPLSYKTGEKSGEYTIEIVPLETANGHSTSLSH